MTDVGDASAPAEPEASHPRSATDSPTLDALDAQHRPASSSSHPHNSAQDATQTHLHSRKSPTHDTANVKSEPMTHTSSSSSNISMKEGSQAGNSTASPYGTRSRNRPGGIRPNYAEDKETDVEYDVSAPTASNGTGTTAKSAQSDNTTNHNLVNGDRPSSTISTRRASAAMASGVTANNMTNGTTPAAKDHIPGTSTFSANPTTSSAPATKKRKTAGSSTISAPQMSSTNHAASHTTTRKASLLSAASGSRLSNMLSFENCQGYLKHGKLRADDGTTLGLNDHVYLICEPPGEPYYLARVMEFLHVNNEHQLPIDSIRVNWYYRPRDIQRKVTDTRVVFASMHSDTCPLTSLRGKCRILHRSEIQDMDEFRKTKDCFWYEKMFDRYIHRYYEVIPTSQVINVPVRVKRVLDERWRFVIVEIGRGKELTSAVKSCKRCNGYSASNDSVECAVCHQTYHMNCVRPPLLKKPSRGFAWACGPCSRQQERKLEARNTPLVGELNADVEEEEVFDEEEEDVNGAGSGTAGGTSSADSDVQDASIHPATAEQIAHSKLWPYRYLGIHCRVEDALDYDDRIYPRASSRLGPRHQANVTLWPGRPVELVKPADIRRKYTKGAGAKKDVKPAKDAVAAIDAEKLAKEKRPKWVMDEPPGYVRRGEDFPNTSPDNTSRLGFRIPELGELIDLTRGGHQAKVEAKTLQLEERERLVDEYMGLARGLSKDVGVREYSTNFLDKALSIFCENDFDMDSSLKKLRTVHKRKDLREPDFNKEEQKRFEEGVARYGSELHSVAKHVKTQKEADIVRYYYMWKKTDKGKAIWGNYEGRKGKKEVKRADASSSKLVDDVADDHDDSAFDNEKASERRRGFACKFCGSQRSPQWRRAPAVAPGTTIPIDPNAKPSKNKSGQLVVALCRRCAELWRRYGIQWEDIDEVARKVAQGGGRAWKRRIDEELLKLLVSPDDVAAMNAGGLGAVPEEPAKKRLKANSEKESTPQTSTAGATTSGSTAGYKKKAAEKTEGPSPAPEMPKPKTMPCAICDRVEPSNQQHLSCKECRMTVHRNCYGVVGEVRNPLKWMCDMCANDKSPQISTSYECVLCPVRFTEHDFVEPPKISHKKKTDKERDKEKMEREVAQAAADFYRRKQEEMHRPVDPREPLKRTAGNNWVHVTCAVWTPEMKFGNAQALEPSEGTGMIPSSRYEQVCKVCKSSSGACIGCHQCHAPVHVECARQAGYSIGFDITPVKSSRRDMVTTVTLGSESGLMTAAVWCKDHAVKTIVHPIDEVVDEPGLNALQLFVRSYKQADLTLTGTVRKANLVNQSTKAINQGTTTTPGVNRRSSLPNGSNGTAPPATPQSATKPNIKAEDGEPMQDVQYTKAPKSEPAKERCVNCGIDVSPKWWIVDRHDAWTNSNRHGPPVPNGHVLNGDRPHTATDSASFYHHHGSRPTMNGHGRGGDVVESAAALAAAALTVDTQSRPTTPAVQCHKCHWKKMRAPSPPRFASYPPRQARDLDSPSTAYPQPTGPPTNAPLPPTGQFLTWSHHSTAPQTAPVTHHTNGFPPPSPAFSPPGPGPQVNGSMSSGPRSMDRAPSQHQPPPGPSTAQHRNAAPSPSLVNGAPPMHSMNGSHPPQMMNGPPPLRPYEGHFTHHPRSTAPPQVHSRPRSSTHERAQMMGDRPTTPRDPPLGPVPTNSSRPSDGRPSTGASASPSLRNLLS